MIKVSVIGLGKMGMQVARKLHEDKFTVIAHNRSREKVDEAKDLGMVSAYTKEEVLAAFGQERAIIWLMIPALSMEEELDLWLKIIPQNSILIDGGNSDFRLTKKELKKYRKVTLSF